MKAKIFLSLAIVAVAFAVVIGFSTFDKASAVPGAGDDLYSFPSGTGNVFGYDLAHNYASGGRDRDVEYPDPAYEEFPNTYHP